MQENDVQTVNISLSEAVEVASQCRRWLLVSYYDSSNIEYIPSPCWPRKEFWEHSAVSVAVDKAFICYTSACSETEIKAYQSSFGDVQLPHLAIINPFTLTRQVLYEGASVPPLQPDDFSRQVFLSCDSFVHQSPANSTGIATFNPPNHLSHRVTKFSEVLTKCKTAQRWLIVNVQDDNLPSLTLNSEIWRHPVIESVILEGFIFWQTCADFAGGSWYMNRYNVKALPHVAILDAESGDILWRKEGWDWDKRLDLEAFAEVIVSLDKRKSGRHRTGSAVISSVAGEASSGGNTSEAGSGSWECLSLCDAWEKLSMGSAGSIDDLEGWEILDSPTHLLHTAATLGEVMSDARDTGRRVIVNIQDDGPSSRALNLDIWRDSRVENLIMEGYYMWQQSSDSKEAKAYCKRFKVEKFPHVAILSPSEDGEQILWTKSGWDWTMDEPWPAGMFIEKLKEYRL